MAAACACSRLQYSGNSSLSPGRLCCLTREEKVVKTIPAIPLVLRQPPEAPWGSLQIEQFRLRVQNPQ